MTITLIVETRIRLKLARAKERKNVRGRFDVSKLQSEDIRRSYNIEVRNTCRFEALGDIDDLEEEHNIILATYRVMQQRKSWEGQRNLVGHG